MREITSTQTVYTFDELSDTAKDNVLQWWSETRWADGVAQEDMEMVAEYELEKAGITYEAGSLTYSDIYSQGGHPSFAGEGTVTIHDRKIDVRLSVRHHGGSRTSIDVELTDPQWEQDYDLDDEATAEWEADYAVAQDDADEAVHLLVQDVFWAMRKADEVDPEDIRDTASANGWEFDDRGGIV